MKKQATLLTFCVLVFGCGGIFTPSEVMNAQNIILKEISEHSHFEDIAYSSSVKWTGANVISKASKGDSVLYLVRVNFNAQDKYDDMVKYNCLVCYRSYGDKIRWLNGGVYPVSEEYFKSKEFKELYGSEEQFWKESIRFMKDSNEWPISN